MLVSLSSTKYTGNDESNGYVITNWLHGKLRQSLALSSGSSSFSSILITCNWKAREGSRQKIWEQIFILKQSCVYVYLYTCTQCNCMQYINDNVLSSLTHVRPKQCMWTAWECLYVQSYGSVIWGTRLGEIFQSPMEGQGAGRQRNCQCKSYSRSQAASSTLVCTYAWFQDLSTHILGWDIWGQSLMPW